MSRDVFKYLKPYLPTVLFIIMSISKSCGSRELGKRLVVKQWSFSVDRQSLDSLSFRSQPKFGHIEVLSLWKKSQGVTLHMQPLQQYFCMVPFVNLFSIILQNEIWVLSLILILELLGVNG